MSEPVQVAVLDMAGTTVADDGLVVAAFDTAATAAGLPADGPRRDRARRYVLDTMGQSKIEVFTALFGDPDRAAVANRAFETAYAELVDEVGVAPIPGAAEAIRTLRGSGVRVALTTGFSRATQDRLLAALGWAGLADLTLCPAEAGRGRPYPDLVLTAGLRLQADAVHRIAVLGDTTSDIATGRAAGAGLVVGTLTGAHREDRLRAAGAGHIVGSVADFPDLVLGTGP